MTTKRFLASTSACALVCAMLVATDGQRAGVASAAGGGQAASQPAGRGGGGQRGGGSGGADAPALGPGILLSGAWGTDTLPLDARGWGWMAQS